MTFLKKLITKAHGLALANTFLSYPYSLLIQLPQRSAKNLPKVNIEFPLGGVISTILYTRYYYPYRMNHGFILVSMVYMQFISMLIRGIFLVFSASSRSDFMQSIQLFSTHTKDSLISTPMNFIIQVVIWYCVILVSNRIAVRWFLKKKITK